MGGPGNSLPGCEAQEVFLPVPFRIVGWASKFGTKGFWNTLVLSRICVAQQKGRFPIIIPAIQRVVLLGYENPGAGLCLPTAFVGRIF
jgi:hypothetical protein